MNQRATLRGIDAQLHAAFAGAGIASWADYLPPGAVPGAVPAPVRVYLDRGAQVLGEFGQVIGRRDEIAFLLADVTPAAKAIVAVDGDRYALTDKVDEDDSLSRWVVRRV